MVQLRRLARRIVHLQRHPDDRKLRDRIRNTVDNLMPAYPELQVVGFFNAECHSELVLSIIERELAEHKARGLAQWKLKLQSSLAKQRAWIKRRTSLEQSLELPKLQGKERIRKTAVHPKHILEEAAKQWVPRWSSGPDSIAGVEKFLDDWGFAARPALAPFTEPWSGEALLRIAKSATGRAPGPDAWAVDDWLHLPIDCWNALAKPWSVIFASGNVPDVWRRARVALVPKPDGSLRPISLLCNGWRLGAKLLVIALREWSESWLDHRTLGGVTRRCAKDAFWQLLVASSQQNLVVA